MAVDPAPVQQRGVDAMEHSVLRPSMEQESSPSPAASRDCSEVPKDNVTPNLTDFALFFQSLLKSNTHKMSYDKNIIPNFDPAQKNQKIENWIAKVNECAKIYGWTDEQTSHFALPKLTGYAKNWYEGLQSILMTWTEWQERLIRAFPSETNYAALLMEMLDRTLKPGESVDEYYYDKMILLNACGIKGKPAVDCLVYAIDDRILRSSAMAARLTDSEDLLKFLKDFCKENNQRTSSKRLSTSVSNEIICFKCNKPGHRAINCRNTNNKDLMCYNCKEKGHISTECPKPLARCDNCNLTGHKSNDCFRNKTISNNNTRGTEKKTMFAHCFKSDSKYYKQAVINKNIELKCYIDFGSDCTLIRQDIVDSHSLPKLGNDIPTIRGFGNNSYTPLGRTTFSLTLGEVTAEVDAYIVDSSLLTEAILVGQDFTERPEVVVMKTHDRLDITRRDPQTD